MKHALRAFGAGIFAHPICFRRVGRRDEADPAVHRGVQCRDTKSAFAAYASGDILIVDEFAPHCWLEPNAAQDWAEAYDKHAQTTGVSDGYVKYGPPTRAEVVGDVAYVIVPAVYNYKQDGRPTAEEGQMTFVLHVEGGAWKISAWTWSGVKPHPAK